MEKQLATKIDDEIAEFRKNNGFEVRSVSAQYLVSEYKNGTLKIPPIDCFIHTHAKQKGQIKYRLDVIFALSDFIKNIFLPKIQPPLTFNTTVSDDGTSHFPADSHTSNLVVAILAFVGELRDEKGKEMPRLQMGTCSEIPSLSYLKFPLNFFDNYPVDSDGFLPFKHAYHFFSKNHVMSLFKLKKA